MECHLRQTARRVVELAVCHTWNAAHIDFGEVSGARHDLALHAFALRPQQQLQLG